MKVLASLSILTALVLSTHAWCMNARSPDAASFDDIQDSCGNAIDSGDVFVLYDEITGNYIGNGESNWLTLTETAPAGFFWQANPHNSYIKFLKGTSGDNCSVTTRAWLGYSGRFLSATGCKGGDHLEFRKWEDGQCKSKGCYQVGLLTEDQPVNGAITNFDSYGYLHISESNCKDKVFKWVVKKKKDSVGWKATYDLDDIQSC